MFTWIIITAALWALFAGAFVSFFGLTLKFFDWVVNKIQGVFKAIKVFILKKNGKLSSGVLVQDQNGKITITEHTRELLPSEVPNDIMAQINAAPTLNNGERLGSPKDYTKEQEMEARNAAPDIEVEK